MSKQIKLIQDGCLVKQRRNRLQHEEQNLTTAQKLGRSGEMWVASLLSMAFRCVYEIRSNNFKEYAKSQAKGVDHRIILGKDAVYAIEDKNLLWQNRPYGTEFVTEQVLPRFEMLDKCVIKILIISYKKLLTKEAIRLLAENHIHVFEVGHVFSVGKHNPRVNPKFFYEQLDRFKKLIDVLDPTNSMFQQSLEATIEQCQKTKADEPFFSFSPSNLSYSEYLPIESSKISFNTELSNLSNFADNDGNTVDGSYDFTESELTLYQNKIIKYQIRLTHDTPYNEQRETKHIITKILYEQANFPLSNG